MKRQARFLVALLLLMVGATTTASAFNDIKINLTGDLVTAEEKAAKSELSFGVVIADDGTQTRVAADDASANIVLSGTYHDDSHGWTNLKAVVPVEGSVRIGLGNCQYGSATVKVNDASGETVATFALPAEQNCWHQDTENNITYGYYSGEATTLTIIGGSYIPYISVEAADAPDTTYDDITATWDFQGNCAGLGAKGSDGSQLTATTIASTVKGYDITVEYNGGAVANNDNSYQVTEGVVLKVPVKSSRDIVTVVGYPGYSSFAFGNSTEALTGTQTHRATPAEAEQGYVAVTSLTTHNYYVSISVLYWSGWEDKSIYSTKFNEWDDLKASETETAIEKQTKYSHETLTFTLYNANVNGGDTSIDLSGKFNNRPVGWISYVKNGGSYVQTSPLASVTTVRFVQGATGSNRGIKLEAKGDGDADWVVISDAVANPASWTEITAEVNRKNCQLRFTNLAESQYAYIFELDINGMVDMSKAPVLGSFKANGAEVVAGDTFDQDADGNYVATIEVKKADAMIGEANPLTDITAENGTIGTVTYTTTGEGTAQQTVANIPVTANGETATYLATFVFKPDFTLTYFDTDGSEMGKQSVEKDAAITEFGIDYADATAEKGQRVRGWFVAADGGKKYSTADIVTGDLSLYAVASDIETQSKTARYTFLLNNQYFYAEDHEAFNPEGTGYWHDGTHGWAFAAGDIIKILVGGKANISLGLCRYSGGNAITLTNSNGEVIDQIGTDKVDSDGQQAVFTYDGPADTLTIGFNGTSYLHLLTIANLGEAAYKTVGENWYVVKAGNATSLINTIEAVNGRNNAANAERAYIFLPDGVYDLGEACLTTISGNNISIIGQSMENTIIVNSPKVENEGIGTTATFIVSGKGTYFQDLTIQNALDYYSSGSAGRAVCLQDKGDHTVCKNVRMLSYQDTYYSNNNSAQLYWEGCDIHGTVDFICGGGDVRFQNTTLSLEPRNINGNGGRTITAPTTTTQFGYVFDGCTIVDLAEGKGNWNFGRTWQNSPICIYLNTKLDDNAKNTLVASRWTEKGMNNTDPKAFGEFNTTDLAGNDITPASNVIKSYTADFETILSAEAAAAYSYDKMFTTWDPAALCQQLKTSHAIMTANGRAITWASVDGAAGYAIFEDGQFVTISEGFLYITTDPSHKYEVRVANAMGGFGEPVEVKSAATGITAVDAAEGQDEIYNIQGVRVSHATKGIYIINGKKVVVK